MRNSESRIPPDGECFGFFIDKGASSQLPDENDPSTEIESGIIEEETAPIQETPQHWASMFGYERYVREHLSGNPLDNPTIIADALKEAEEILRDGDTQS